MRTHTQAFKDGIKQYGRQFNDFISYYPEQGTTATIFPNQINRVNYSVDTTLMKSVMQQLTFDLSYKIDTSYSKKVNYQISLKGVNNSTIQFNNFNIEKVEEQKDKKSYIYTCYDNMIKAMVDYESLGVTYPITIRDYLIAICNHLGLTFKNASDTFTNYNKQVTSEHYIDADGNKMGYTFRDVLDDIAEAVGGFICIDNNGQLEIRYISNAISSKNLLEIKRKNYTSSGITTTYNSNTGVLHSSGTTTTSWPWIVDTTLTTPIPSGTTLTFSTKNALSYGVSIRLYYTNNDREEIGISAGSLSNKRTITHDIIRIAILLNRGANVEVNQDFYLQLEKGNTKTDFEPYGDTINEDYFSDKNVNIGKKIGPYNTLVLSRASDSDNIHRPTTLPQEPIELKISDNAILDQDNREDFIDGIFNQINGLEFYLNDFATTGILYYEIGDKYNVSIDGTTYPCLMLSDDIKRTTGLKENIVTREPKQSVTPYKYSSTTDKVEISSRNAYIIADKANGTASMIVEGIGQNGVVTGASVVAAINGEQSQVSIDADKINLNGAVTANNNFKIKTDGSVEINNGSIDLVDDGTLQNAQIKVTSTNYNFLSTLFSGGLTIQTSTSNFVSSLDLNGFRSITRNTDGSNQEVEIYNSPGQDVTSTNCYITAIQNLNNSTEDSYGISISPKSVNYWKTINNVTTEPFKIDGTTGDTTIGGDITASGSLFVDGQDVKNYMGKSYQNVNANDFRGPGVYYLTQNCTNVPYNYIYLLVLGKIDNGDFLQVAYDVSTSRIWKRTYANGTWYSWELVGGYKSYNVGDYLVNNWSSNGLSCMMNSNGIKYLQFSVRNGTSTTVVSSLPNDMRPSNTLIVMASNLGGIGYVIIYTTGEIIVYGNIYTSGASNLVFSATYI